jgi:uncharacterized protein YbaR (Trm112 family)
LQSRDAVPHDRIIRDPARDAGPPSTQGCKRMAESLSPDLLEILVCPETHQKLRPADAALVERLRERQAQGRLLNRAGKPVAEAPDAALVREDGQFAYLVVDQIPIMLIDEAIPLEQLAS